MAVQKWKEEQKERLRNEEVDVKQDEGVEQEDNRATDSTYLQNRTISRDETELAAVEKEKLAALSSPGDTLAHQRAKSLSQSTLLARSSRTRRIYSPEHALGYYPRLDMDRAQESESVLSSIDLNHGILPPALPQAYWTPHPHQEHPDILTSNDTGRIIEQLKAEILRLRNQEEPSKATEWIVIHRVPGDSMAYLAEPSWNLADSQTRNQKTSQTPDLPRLRGNRAIANESRYLNSRPELAFVVYRHYSHTHQKEEIQKAIEEGCELPHPKPIRETIRMLSNAAIKALDLFMNRHPSKTTDFPDWDSGGAIDAPYLFWYRYRSSGQALEMPEPEKRQLHLLIKWISKHYNHVYDLVDAELKNGCVSDLSLPFLIRGGESLVAKDEKQIHQGYVVESWRTNKPEQLLRITAWQYRFDGRFHRQIYTLNVNLRPEMHQKPVPITSLNVYPLKYATSGVRAQLTRRCETAWKCRKRAFIEYRADSGATQTREEYDRYIVDYETYSKLHPDSTKTRNKSENPILSFATKLDGRSEEMDPEIFACNEPPPEPDLFAFPDRLTAYNLRQKNWQTIHVDRVRDISWNKKAFDHLVIDPQAKELIQALVTNKINDEQSTDLIQGKGNGLIILLHGSPGTGKTFTAESVAEIAEKPLYRVTCGDIGTKPEQVEKYLESVLHLGKIWDCVVLLDEADVFLEQRTLTDLERNALVSVFLRVLEYYEGILILTSNRVGTFDEAFKSRIQLSLHYEPLTKGQRHKIWRNFLDNLRTLEQTQQEAAKVEPMGENRKRKLAHESLGIDFDDIECYLGELAEKPMNGRQIRNAITTARQLAKFKGVDMSYVHLKHVIGVSKKFDEYLEKVQDGCTDEDIARGGGIR